LGIPAQGGLPGVQLITEWNYGFRGDADSLALTLIRSSYDPDPYPEVGIHKLHFAVRVVGQPVQNKDLVVSAHDYTHPVDVVSGAGMQPGRLSFLELESGSVAVSALKAPEEGDGRELIVRLYETDGLQTQAVLRFNPDLCGKLTGAVWVDSHEQPVEGGGRLTVQDERLVCEMKPFALAAVKVNFTLE
jgi:alpha-mannosidase